MWNEPSSEELNQLPDLYQTEHQAPAHKMIYMHFFIGACDWYLAEYSPQQKLFFGYTILNDDLPNSEWGYTSLVDLCSFRLDSGMEIERDRFWEVRPASRVERIVRAGGL